MSEPCTLPRLPEAAGAYRWFYADVSAGPFSAVCIFMLGSLFSPRYSAAARRGGRPAEHSAVNFALYHEGTREAWVLSEYPEARVEAPGRLAIGRSSLTYADDGAVRMEVVDWTAPWGRPVRARLLLEPLTPAGEEVTLAPELPHYWRALAPRARARLEVETLGVAVEGLGYHDTNHGEELLGERLSGWHWTRTHRADSTVVDYHLPGRFPALRLTASATAVSCARGPTSERRSTYVSSWGLRIPERLDAGPAPLGEPRLLESSPFYARLELRERGLDSLGEVADFRRFHSPFIRWMAHFRTRVEHAA
ncbi:carotenoid 1,2-hydratase [Corallococcus sp. H22C18031201]|nr:carotenoid 1,2-hydratase [Corallococcus sp. H22C18031201]